MRLFDRRRGWTPAVLGLSVVVLVAAGIAAVNGRTPAPVLQLETAPVYSPPPPPEMGVVLDAGEPADLTHAVTAPIPAPPSAPRPPGNLTSSTGVPLKPRAIVLPATTSTQRATKAPAGSGKASTLTAITVSRSATGELGDGTSWQPSLSADGRFVAYTSDATNLVVGDTNGLQDVFVHDLVSRVTVRASVGSDGEQADGSSTWPSISGDGSLVAFQSPAASLGAIGGELAVFLHDMHSGTTTLVAQAAMTPQISNDGRWLLWNDKRTGDAVLLDRQTGDADSLPAGAARNRSGRLTGDGRHFVFCSSAAVTDSTEAGYFEIYVYDVDTGRFDLLSKPVAGDANLQSFDPSASDDGSTAVFSSNRRLTPDDTDDWMDTFVQDRTKVATTMAPRNDSARYSVREQAISGDGRMVAIGIASADSNDPRNDVFAWERTTGHITRLLTTGGTQITAASARGFDWSTDGRTLAASGTGLGFSDDEPTHKNSQIVIWRSP
jgi:Tol biopolymer transport system component